MAKRRRFQIEHGGFAETFFVFAEFPSIDKTSLKKYSAKCYKYATRSKIIPFTCLLFDTIICFPIALVDSIDDATAEATRSEAPPTHWAGGYEMAVVCDPKAEVLCYSEKTAYVGRLFYDYFREIIRNMLSP